MEHRRNMHDRGGGHHRLACVCGYSTHRHPEYADALTEFRAHADDIFSGVVAGFMVRTEIGEDGVAREVMGNYTLIQDAGDHTYVRVGEG